MTHKVHPKIFRIKETSDWKSRGFYGKSPRGYLKEDFEFRKFLKRRLKDCGVESIEIERFLDKTTIIIESSRPAFIIGRGGKGIEELKKEMEKLFFKKREDKRSKELKIEIKEVRDPWARPNLTAQWIVYRLEKRFPFRRTLKQALEKIMVSREVKGARVEVAGRLDGLDIARTEWLKKGCLPRQSLRADIDYGTAEAHCTYGVIGVKVWIYRGEKF